jgi:hypothetical protein
MGTATAVSDSSILLVDKNKMVRLLHAKHALSDRFIAHGFRLQTSLLASSSSRSDIPSRDTPAKRPRGGSQCLCTCAHATELAAHKLHRMFKLITTMRRGSSTGLAAAWARYATVEAARLGTSTLLRDDRILRVMIVRNEIPPAFVEWAER